MTNSGDRKIYSVSALTREIKALLQGEFASVWVEGEVSNLKVAVSGHAYFSLKDDQSLLNCVLFKNSASGSQALRLEEGMHLLCSGRISVYDQRGAYQLYVERIEPIGKGALSLAFEQLKKKLEKEGLFDEARKKKMPVMPMRIGVVTSPTGAVIRDILKVARRRFANVEITLRPVKVQGDGAKDEIAAAIAELNEYNKFIGEEAPEEHAIDVMIVGRGGGSVEELWPFNEEIVARAIYASEIPVVSAVGHETDFTISDFVADMRAPTPSAAAEMAVPRKDEMAAMVGAFLERVYQAQKERIVFWERSVAALKDSYILREPVNVFLQMKQRIDEMVRSAMTSVTHGVDIRARELATACGRLNALSPLAVLERGYSATFKGDKVVRSAAELRKGDSVTTRLAKGEITATVEQVKDRAGST